MPNYTNNAVAMLLRDNRQAYLWQAEAVTAPQASIAFQLERLNRTFYPWGVSFELWFSATPGVFEVDIQTADVDLDTHYCTINQWSSTAQLNASFVGRIELPNFWAKYVRGYVKTLTNPVNVSLLVTR